MSGGACRRFSSPVAGDWKDIWRLKVPPKIKNLIWRMCRGCLPTRVQLQDKGVSFPTRYASCSSKHKDLNHIFFECPFTIQVWNTAGIWQVVQDVVLNNNSAVNAIFHLFQNLPTHLQQRFAVLCWSLWKH